MISFTIAFIYGTAADINGKVQCDDTEYRNIPNISLNFTRRGVTLVAK